MNLAEARHNGFGSKEYDWKFKGELGVDVIERLRVKMRLLGYRVIIKTQHRNTKKKTEDVYILMDINLID